MHPLLLRTKARIRDAAKPIGAAVVGALTIGLLRATRYFDPIKTADLFARIAQRIGPLTREQKTARANLTAAFPEKSPEEIEQILAGVWDNLGRYGAEFAHLDHVWEHDPAHPENSRIEIQPRTHELFAQLRLDGKPALIFSSHLGSFELAALAAVAHGLDAKGQHVAILVDQYFTNGVDVTFFGRKTKANPTLARLLRQIECPIHGVRIIRLPGHRFRAELSEEIPPVRDAAGQIDVQGTMQAITSVVEGWIREYPDQWWWVHRRWR
jgi:KDO2-lipid IV(A) lauroyltransferase